MKLLKIAILLLLTTSPVWAWWHEGHQLVTLVAKEHLTESCQTKVMKLLKHHPDPRVRTLEQASSWPDVIKEEDDPFHSYDRSDWHYADSPIPDPDAGTHHGQLVEQIIKQGEILTDTRQSKSDRAVALSWYVHLVGDIHQPLHNVSYYSEEFPEGDRGGNHFFVVLGQRPIALHILWDSVGARFAEKPPEGRLRNYADSFQQTFPLESMANLVEIDDPKTWSVEGLILSRDRIYPNLRHNDSISNAVLQETLDLTKRQICLAGYRLAVQLNKWMED